MLRGEGAGQVGSGVWNRTKWCKCMLCYRRSSADGCASQRVVCPLRLHASTVNRCAGRMSGYCIYIYIYIYVYVDIYIYIIIIMIVLIVILVIIVIVVIIIMIMIMMIMESPRIALRDSGRPARREPRPAWPHSSRHHSSNYLFNLCIDGVIINECKH